MLETDYGVCPASNQIPPQAGLDWPGLGDKSPFGQSPKEKTPPVLLGQYYFETVINNKE